MDPSISDEDKAPHLADLAGQIEKLERQGVSWRRKREPSPEQRRQQFIQQSVIDVDPQTRLIVEPGGRIHVDQIDLPIEQFFKAAMEPVGLDEDGNQMFRSQTEVADYVSRAAEAYTGFVRKLRGPGAPAGPAGGVPFMGARLPRPGAGPTAQGPPAPPPQQAVDAAKTIASEIQRRYGTMDRLLEEGRPEEIAALEGALRVLGADPETSNDVGISMQESLKASMTVPILWKDGMTPVVGQQYVLQTEIDGEWVAVTVVWDGKDWQVVK
jgi:hypothetical protein